MHRPRGSTAWLAVVAFIMVAAALVLLVLAAFSDLSPVLGCALLAIGCLMSMVGLLQLKNGNPTKPQH